MPSSDATDDGPVTSAREVEVRAPGGRVFRFRLAADDTAVVLVDGHPVAELGAAFGDAAQERLGRRRVAERYVVVRGMNAEEFRGLAPHLGLPDSWFGRWKAGPDELRDISLDEGELSCGNVASLRLAIEYVETLGLAYDETLTMHHPARRPTS